MKRLNKDITKTFGLPARKLSKYQFLTKGDIDDALFQEYLKRRTPENYDPFYKYYEEPLNRLIASTFKQKEKEEKKTQKNWFSRVRDVVNGTAIDTGQKIGKAIKSGVSTISSGVSSGVSAISSGVSSLMEIATGLFSSLKDYIPFASEIEPEIKNVMELDKHRELPNPDTVAENIVGLIGANLLDMPAFTVEDNERKHEGVLNFIELLDGVIEDPTNTFSPQQRHFAENALENFRGYFHTYHVPPNPFANVGTFEIKAEQPVDLPKGKTNKRRSKKALPPPPPPPPSVAYEEAAVPSAVLTDDEADYPPIVSTARKVESSSKRQPTTPTKTRKRSYVVNPALQILVNKKGEARDPKKDFDDMLTDIVDDDKHFIDGDLNVLNRNVRDGYNFDDLPLENRKQYIEKWKDALKSTKAVIDHYGIETGVLIDLLKSLPIPPIKTKINLPYNSNWYSGNLIKIAMKKAQTLIGTFDKDLIRWYYDTFSPLLELLNLPTRDYIPPRWLGVWY